MKHIGIALNFLLLCLTGPAAAQQILCEPNNRSSATGISDFYATYRIDTTVSPKIPEDVAKDVTFSGYRVQVFFGNDRNMAQSIKAQLSNELPWAPVYLVYEQPYFKVRVGDYRTRLESQAMLKEMKMRYRESLIVPDKINFPTLDKNQ